MFTNVFFVTFLVFAVRGDDCGISNPNEFLDQILEKAHSKIDDTFPLKDFNEGLVKYESGVIWGLNTLSREGKVEVECSENVTKIVATLRAAEPIRARYEWRAGTIVKLNGVAYARSNAFTARAVFVQQDKYWKVEKIQVLNLSDIQVDVSGLAHASWLWSRMTSFMANQLQGSVALAVRKPFMTVFNRYLQTYK